ncbi:MAG: hypothetical protein PUC50_00130 [Bacteroidales bacterium]|nr:hypothetical protein [Bacteroidales bacterium]
MFQKSPDVLKIITCNAQTENTLNKITVDKGSGIFIDKNGDLDMRIVIDRFVQTVKRFRNDEKQPLRGLPYHILIPQKQGNPRTTRMD